MMIALNVSKGGEKNVGQSQPKELLRFSVMKYQKFTPSRYEVGINSAIFHFSRIKSFVVVQKVSSGDAVFAVLAACIIAHCGLFWGAKLVNKTS